MDLESQPKMVGREEQLSELKALLDKSRHGHGNTVFIAGEAGVGKTRLLEELKEYTPSTIRDTIPPIPETVEPGFNGLVACITPDAAKAVAWASGNKVAANQ